jgi:hypothetical protein
LDLELDLLALLADLIHDLVLLLLLLLGLCLCGGGLGVGFLGGCLGVHFDFLLLLRLGQLEKELVGFELRLVVQEGARELEGAPLHVELAWPLPLA